MVRPLIRLGVALAAIGAFGAVWYAVAGTHGCDDFGGNPACDRMERDFTIYVISLTTLAVGLVVTLVVGLIAVKRRSTGGSSTGGRE